MKSRNFPLILRGISALFLSAAVILTIVSLVGYSRQRNSYPAGMTIAGVPVGGVDPVTASQRVLQVYTSPVMVEYLGSNILITPSQVGFQVNMDAMLAAADLTRTGASFWGGFWDYLWNRPPAAADVPLVSELSEARLRDYLQNEIALRYDTPPAPAQPIPGTTNFLPGAPGQTLDVERAVTLIEDALRSPSSRAVALTSIRTAAAHPTLDNLEILLKQIIQLNDFDGLVGLYMLDLQTGQEIHFAENAGQPLSVQPDVAFTASSTAKIPIMVSYYSQFGAAALDPKTLDAMVDMIRRSENPPADKFMAALDENRGPLLVTEKMKALGLENTFMAGYFYQGAPLLQRMTTPSNSRVDVSANPDDYNQTTPSDMGILLEDLYQCADKNGGALVAVFPGKISQQVCQQMIEILVQDKLGALLQAGVPEGTRIAHKHGWITNNAGVINNVSDAAIVYSPGGNYVIAVYTYHPVQIVFDNANKLFGQISQAVYNYFNVSTQ
ncbi:MAG TPA: serine hydrolase [Anaerolineales bacterium]|nr:serine hydrolase [Anaerolineales bacterium]